MKKIGIAPRARTVSLSMKLAHLFSASLLVAIFTIGGSFAFRAKADCSADFINQIRSGDPVTGNNLFSFDVDTNFSCRADQDAQFQFAESSNGIYASCSANRNIYAGSVVNDSCSVAGAASAEPWIQGVDPFGGSGLANSIARLSECIVIQFVPTTNDQTAPTSISFQGYYNIQGQATADYDYKSGDLEIDLNVGGDEYPITITDPPGLLYTPAATVSISTNVLGPQFGGTLGAANTNNIELYDFQADVDCGTPGFVVTNANGNGYETSSTPNCSYNLSCTFLYFTNIVDQNNQPVSPANFIFWCVDPSDATNLWYTLIKPGPHYLNPLPPLQVIPNGNGLVIQWPLGESNLQLQETCNLATGPWTTNSLPAPVQAGAYWRVSIPMTKARAFFRLTRAN